MDEKPSPTPDPKSPDPKSSDPKAPDPKSPASSGRMPMNVPSALMVGIFSLLVLWWIYSFAKGTPTEISYDRFRQQLEEDNIAEAHFVSKRQLIGKFRHAPAPDKSAPEKPAEEKSQTDAADKPVEQKGDQASSAAAPSKTSPDGKTSNEKAPDAKAPDAKAHDEKASDEKAPSEAPAPKLDFIVVLSPLLDGHGEQLDNELRSHNVKIVNEPEPDGTFLAFIVYLLIIVSSVACFWMLWSRMRDQGMGAGILQGFSKSPAKRYEATMKNPITFANVAGLEGVKNDLQEVVDFLKSPEKFQRLGGRVPKGILLMGPPGTGKTLLARAVAGEAGVPFFSISGSEFIQMFVGVGASRVRDMFKTAKDAAPSILFIDEIDAVGRVRGAGLGGGHDEREQTLNQILSEMDGFSQTESVIVLASTNRPDVLDPALLRPGRFDRHVTVDRPNHKGRVEILQVHSREVPLADDVDLDRIASGSVGLTGADLRNLVNEAALWAARNDKDQVDMSDFEHARDKVLMGPKRDEVLIGKEKTMTAFHEAGHALLAWSVPGADRVHKVTIIPRGRALGVTQLLPDEDRMNIGETELHARLVFILGGRAAEKLIFDEFSAGAENDLTQCTRIARRMVTAWGMSERLGPVAYRQSEEHPFLGKEIYEHREFSDHTAQLIDEEVARILHAADLRAMELLGQNREQLTLLATELEKREMLDEYDIEQLIGPSIRGRAKRNGHADSPDVPGGVIAPGVR